MITIEEIIIRSLYHRLVLVRIKRSSPTVGQENKETDGVSESSESRGTSNQGLGYLYLGPGSDELQPDLPSPRNVFVDTISLEKLPARPSETTIRSKEEQVFLTSQIGRIIRIGELHLATRRVRSSTEVQTDFEPIWCFNKSGSPIKQFGSRESLVNLDKCNDISLVRLESLEQPEQRSLVVVNSISELTNQAAAEYNDSTFPQDEKDSNRKTDGHAKIYNTKLGKSRSSSEEASVAVEDLATASPHLRICINNNLNEGLVGSYKIFNITDEGQAVLVLEESSEGTGTLQQIKQEATSKQKSDFEFGGIGDVLKPASFVKFVINRVEADGSEGKSLSDVPVDSIPTTVNYGEIKFKESQEGGLPKIRPMGSYFRERRRSSQKRSRSLRRCHGSAIDGEKLLKHIMSCGAHESNLKSEKSGFSSAQDIITITDFKISPLHSLHGLNSSQLELRNQHYDEFSSGTAEFLPSKLERKSRSERSSPLMMTSGRFLEDESFAFLSNETDSKIRIGRGIPCDTLWNTNCDFPASATNTSLRDDTSLYTLDSSTVSGSVEFEKFPDWMRNLPPKLKSCPLTQLCIPGSHIALAIERDMKTSMDFSKCNYEMAEFLRRLPNLPVFNSFRLQMKHVWKAWMPKQGLSVYDQLNAGSRYLDMRVTKHSNILYGEHGLYTGQLKRYLKEVRLFLEEQSQEVVIIHLHLSDFVETMDKKHLVTLLFQVFGAKMACWDKEICGEKMKANFPSIEELLRIGKQAIVFMPAEDVHAYARNHIFGGSVWPDNLINISAPKKQTLEELKLTLDECYSSLINAPSQVCINVLMAVLSPDMSMVFGRYDKRRSMKELSFLDISPLLTDWLAADGGKKYLNVIALDFIGAPGLVRSILQLNQGGDVSM